MSVNICRTGRIWLRRAALFLVFGAAMMGDSLPWGTRNIRQIASAFTEASPAMSVNGDVFRADDLSGYTQVTKTDASGRNVFSVKIGGTDSIREILVGRDGNVYVTGYATLGIFPTKLSTYEPPPNANSAPFLCKLSAADGRVLFCSYVDVRDASLTVDTAGNAYLGGSVCFDKPSCRVVEKINSSGTALVYQVLLASFGGFSSAAADIRGNLYVTVSTESSSFVLILFDPLGQVRASIRGEPSEYASVQVDPAGNPQILIHGFPRIGTATVRRYSADLSTVLYDTKVSGFRILPLQMMIGPTGETLLLGGTDSADFRQFHPTAACSLPSLPERLPIPFDAFGFPHAALARLDDAGRIVQSTFLPGINGPVVAALRPDGATVLRHDLTSQVQILTLAQVEDVQFGCIANAASWHMAPLAPGEIVSLVGQNLGPAPPMSAKPVADSTYPFEIGGTQVTFDGVLAPLLSVSTSQIDAVTPVGLLPGTSTHVCVVVKGVRTNCIEAPVQLTAPGIFLSGTIADLHVAGYASALNQDGSVNTQDNPAPVGSIVSIFATGLGLTTPPLPDGSVVLPPLPIQDYRISVLFLVGFNWNEPRFGSAEVLYAGPAPYAIQGLTQINFRVPPPQGTADGSLYLAPASSSIQAGTATGVFVWTAPAH